MIIVIYIILLYIILIITSICSICIINGISLFESYKVYYSIIKRLLKFIRRDNIKLKFNSENISLRYGTQYIFFDENTDVVIHKESFKIRGFIFEHKKILKFKFIRLNRVADRWSYKPIKIVVMTPLILLCIKYLKNKFESSIIFDINTSDELITWLNKNSRVLRKKSNINVIISN